MASEKNMFNTHDDVVWSAAVVVAAVVHKANEARFIYGFSYIQNL